MADVAGSHSLSELEAEREELRKDLAAWSNAYALLHRRLLEVTEEFPHRGEILRRWSGTWASIGALEMASHTIEKKLREVSELIRRLQSGELPNRDTPRRGLSIVKEDKDG